MPRVDPGAWDDKNLALIFVAGSVVEAQRAEVALDSAGIEYGVEPQEYMQGLLFSSTYTGLGFYVIEGQALYARRALRNARLHSGIVEPES